MSGRVQDRMKDAGGYFSMWAAAGTKMTEEAVDEDSPA